MHIKVLGSGGAFAPIAVGNSAFLVEMKGRRILIDCGSTVPYVLRDEMDIPLQSITDLVITHCHADHIGGVEQLLWSCYYIPGGAPPRLWAADEVYDDLAAILRPSMSYLVNVKPDRVPIVDTFFDEKTTRLYAGVPQPFYGTQITFFRAQHIKAMPAHGVQIGGLYVSGDTNVATLPSRLPGIDLCFHETEIGPFASGVHVPLAELKKAAELTSDSLDAAKKTWLYHCPQQPEGFDLYPFRGVLKKGDTFDIPS